MVKRLLLALAFLAGVVAAAPASAQTDTCRIRQGTTCIVTATDVVPQSPNVTNLGSASNPFLALYVKNVTFVAGGNATLPAAGALTWLGRSAWSSPADGSILMTNTSATAWKVIIGSTTSNGLMLKQANAAGNLLLRTGDDSADASVNAFSFNASGIVVSTPTQITAGAGTGITVNDAGSLRPAVYKVTVLSTNFIAAATTADVTLATLPAKTAIAALIVDQTVTFACASVCTTSTLSFTCGKTAGGNEYLLSWDADAATGQFGITQATIGAALKVTTPPITMLGDLPNWSGTTAVQCRLTSGTGNIGTGAATNLSQGSITVDLVTVRMP